MIIRIGSAGWSNPPVERARRNPVDSHLEHYSARFSCVEINSSFYKPHQAATYARWRDTTPPGFRFSVKMPRSITHEAGLRRAARQVSQFYSEISHLQSKLKAVLVQLPPSLEYESRFVRAFFKAVPKIPGIVLACEPRHTSWFSAAADTLLRELKVVRVGADPARCPAAAEAGGLSRFAYFRWHGSPRVYYSRYSDAQLKAFAAIARRSSAKEVWCIFDNTARYAAWENALCFKRVVGSMAVT